MYLPCAVKYGQTLDLSSLCVNVTMECIFVFLKKEEVAQNLINHLGQLGLMLEVKKRKHHSCTATPQISAEGKKILTCKDPDNTNVFHLP